MGTEKIKRVITIEVEDDDKGNLKGVKIKSEGLFILEAIAILEISKMQMVESQTKKNAWDILKR